MKVFKNITFFALVAICFSIGLSGFTSNRTPEQSPITKSYQDEKGFRFIKEQNDLIKPVIDHVHYYAEDYPKHDNTNYQLIHWQGMSYQLKK